MKIALLANLMTNAPAWEGMPADQWDDLDSQKTIDALLAALEANGHQAAFFEANIHPPFNLVDRLRAFAPDLCFNIAEGHFGDGREAQIPALLEMLRLPYTGSRVLTLALALDKPMTKRVLAYHGLPTPEFQVFERPDDPLDDGLLAEGGMLRFPLFVKPSREGTGMGVSAASIVHTVEALRAQVAEQAARYHQPILVERYIAGREVTVGVIGNGHTLTCLPAFEVDLAAYPASEANLYTNRIKTDLVDTFYWTCPADLEPAVAASLNRLTERVFHATGCADVARVDFRLDEGTQTPYILEVNPLPGLNPAYSDLCIEARVAGWSYEGLIEAIVQCALQRWRAAPHRIRPALP